MTVREGNLQAPTRHPLDWRNPEFYSEESLHKEMERVFDICHGCRRCVSLCNSFPTLFDLVDESKTMEVDGVAKADYAKVVDQCYLCDVCYMTKCPYVPPHPWNLDFPHLMLRAKAVHYRQHGARFRDRLLTGTDRLGKLATIPVVVQVVNKVNTMPSARAVMDKVLGVAKEARLPPYDPAPFRKSAAASIAWPVRDGGEDARQGRRVLDLLRQLQRARHRPRPARHPRAQRDRVPDDRERGLLRHAQAGAGRPRDRREAEERQHPRARRARPRRLRADDAGAVVHADVQAGAAADLPRGRRRPGRRRRDVRPVRVPRAARQGRAAEEGLQAAAGQGQLPHPLPRARAERRAEDARGAGVGARDQRQHRRALRRPRRHLRRQVRVLRRVDEDRQAGVRPDGADRSPTS